jgi:hypothetical protein
VYLFVPTRYGQGGIRLSESDVVSEEGPLMLLERALNAGDGVALMREEGDVAEFGGGERGDHGGGEPSLYVMCVVGGPRHGVYQVSSGVRWRSGTS